MIDWRNSAHCLDHLYMDAAVRRWPDCIIHLRNKWGNVVCGNVPPEPAGLIEICEQREGEWTVWDFSGCGDRDA